MPIVENIRNKFYINILGEPWENILNEFWGNFIKAFGTSWDIYVYISKLVDYQATTQKD